MSEVDYHLDADADDPPRPCDVTPAGPCSDCDDYLCRQRSDEGDV
ncbi:MAG: hypothetical protein ACYTBJ_02295 [Planctomycetota bacterium]